MPTPIRYLVELRPTENGFEDIQSLGAGSRAASEELSRNGTRVRFLRSIFLPEDGSCLLVFEGASAEAVLEACRLTSLVPERISEALDPNDQQFRELTDVSTARARDARRMSCMPAKGG